MEVVGRGGRGGQVLAVVLGAGGGGAEHGIGGRDGDEASGGGGVGGVVVGVVEEGEVVELSGGEGRWRVSFGLDGWRVRQRTHFLIAAAEASCGTWRTA